MKQLIEYLNSINKLSPKLELHLLDVLKYKEYKKNEFLLKEGQVCKSINYISIGCVRSYYKKFGNEICSWFMMEGDVIISVDSFFNQVPAYESIQAIENTTVFYIDYNELQFLYYNYPEFNLLCSSIITTTMQQQWIAYQYSHFIRPTITFLHLLLAFFYF